MNRFFWSKRAHRVLTILFILSLFAYGNVIGLSMSDTSAQGDFVGAGLGLFAAYYYDMFYGVYFVIRFIWRIFNKPDINQYEIDKKTMPRDEFMRKYGVYRP